MPVSSPKPISLARDFTAVSWNLHKGRSPLGFQAWSKMRQWLQSACADVYFLQEALAQRTPATTSRTDKEVDGLEADLWHCQTTEFASTLRLQFTLGTNVFKSSRQHGNAILSAHPLAPSGRWDISAHRFERRGLLAARVNVHGQSITLLCAHLALTRAARLRQMHWIAQQIQCEAPSGPLVLAGDFNDWKNDSIALFREIGLIEVATALGVKAKTFPAFSPKLALDKMFVRGLTPIEWLIPAQSTAWLSDHLPYTARLLID